MLLQAPMTTELVSGLFDASADRMTTFLFSTRAAEPSHIAFLYVNIYRYNRTAG